MKPIIRVENLSKQYRIGAQQASYGTFRDSLTNAITAPFRNFRKNPQSAIRNPQSDLIWALKDINFEVQPGEVVGIIGRNGAGKSTLLKILSRITEPTTGKIDLHGRVSSLLEVGTGFHPELTGRENIYLNGAVLGMKRAEITRKFDEIVAFAEIEKFLDTPVKHYSSGMYMRLAFSVAAHLEPEILVVDEVLAVGDMEFQKKCVGKMGQVANEGRTVIFVSHNLAVIERLCTNGVLLGAGMVECSGNISNLIKHYLLAVPKNEAVFESELVTSASVQQKEDEIEIKVNYEAEEVIDAPCLGFVISDYLGNPICGINPIYDGKSSLFSPASSGKIRILLKYPKLLNGNYYLSLWLGNGKKEFFVRKECLTFEIINMAPPMQQLATSVGAVLPICDWFFKPLSKNS